MRTTPICRSLWTARQHVHATTGLIEVRAHTGSAPPSPRPPVPLRPASGTPTEILAARDSGQQKGSWPLPALIRCTARSVSSGRRSRCAEVIRFRNVRHLRARGARSDRRARPAPGARPAAAAKTIGRRPGDSGRAARRDGGSATGAPRSHRAEAREAVFAVSVVHRIDKPDDADGSALVSRRCGAHRGLSALAAAEEHGR